ncbi:MAG: helix-turn-helix domain-containing protein [Rectinema sp.]|nr:helix-turn-helix domain-containing protein [Rectinema sp.]
MNDDTRYTIDDLVTMTGFSRRTIRFYVERGLLEPPAGRGKGAFYGTQRLERLRQIQRARREGRSLASLLATGYPKTRHIEEYMESPAIYAMLKEPFYNTVSEPSMIYRYALAPRLYLEVDASHEARYRSLIEAIVALVRDTAGQAGFEGEEEDHEIG